jgi:hypothetical protein
MTKERKLKLIISLFVVLSAILISIQHLNQKNLLNAVVPLSELKDIQKEINLILRSSCEESRKILRVNQQNNFATLNFKNLELKGSVYNVPVNKNLSLKEINLENTFQKIRFRLYMFWNQENSKCYGQVF